MLPAVRRQRLLEPVDQVRVERVRDPEADHDCGERDDDARAELAEMLDERRLLAIGKPARERLHGLDRVVLAG